MSARTAVLLAAAPAAALMAAALGHGGGAKAAPSARCSGPRLAVRTLSDSGARTVNYRPTGTTVAALARMSAPRNPKAHRVRRVETRTFRITAQLVEARRPAGGLELVVADAARPHLRLAVEFPDPRCGSRPRRKAQMAAARSAFIGACGTLSGPFSPLRGTATITGVGFVDPKRNPETDAANGLGLQPALAFRSYSCGGAPAATMLAAGDIAGCGLPGDEATLKLVLANQGIVAALGDNAYENGSAQEYAKCYAPTWGRVQNRTRPAPGNHEYQTPDASGYFDYFGAAAGPGRRGYYSYDLAQWHVVVIDSECVERGGCAAGSPQVQWLRDDLAASSAACTLAYWHHPRFSSGSVHGSNRMLEPIWQALYDGGADVVLSGHDHDYERFTPQTPQGKADPVRGIREFVVGTGGRSHYAFGKIVANSEVRNADTFGILELTLRPSGYDWSFLPEAGKSFTDSGSAACH